tara:strand:+ start:124 stop:474 length:351 start_codon:yes stop_codon:yes gene_type:complete
MPTALFTLPIDGRAVTGEINYIHTSTGVVPIALWIKLDKTDTYLDRELRASGKLISRCFQNNESLKELVETLSVDNVIGIVANYLDKNLEDILMAIQPTKKQRMLSTDPYASQMKE